MTIAYRERTKTTLIIVHVALTRPSEARPLEVIRWRDRKSGMLDIGHHVIIDRDGTPHFIRPPNAMGCHTPGHNHESLSICLMGGVSEEGDFEDNFTWQQMSSLGYVVGMALGDWPKAEVKHRREVQRRKGDQPGLPFEMPDFAPAPFNKLTELVALKPPKQRIRDVKGQNGGNPASETSAGVSASPPLPNADDCDDKPGDRLPDGSDRGVAPLGS